MHDGILVGVGTALNDDPQLNSKELGHFTPGAER
jgi:riboflavin biosynthesis pyrimidine reductase